MVPLRPEISVILYNIRSAHNVGSIFRTADGIKATQLYLCGYTPLPVDRFGREQPDIIKTALGAHESISWEHHENCQKLIQTLKADGTRVVAVEQYTNAIDYTSYTPKGKTAVIFGNETEGVPEDICRMADTVVSIPMRGSKESLNVSVAAGIVLYQFTVG